MSSDKCATIIDEATGRKCEHRLSEHKFWWVGSVPGEGPAHLLSCRAHQRNPDAPEGTDRRLPCPCSNFTPEGT